MRYLLILLLTLSCKSKPHQNDKSFKVGDSIELTIEKHGDSVTGHWKKISDKDSIQPYMTDGRQDTCYGMKIIAWDGEDSPVKSTYEDYEEIRKQLRGGGAKVYDMTWPEDTTPVGEKAYKEWQRMTGQGYIKRHTTSPRKKNPIKLQPGFIFSSEPLRGIVLTTDSLDKITIYDGDSTYLLSHYKPYVIAGKGDFDKCMCVYQDLVNGSDTVMVYYRYEQQGQPLAAGDTAYLVQHPPKSDTTYLLSVSKSQWYQLDKIVRRSGL